MDKIEKYSQIIPKILTTYVVIPIANGEIESYTVFDTLQHHYQVINVGWDGYRRVYRKSRKAPVFRHGDG